MVGSAVAGCGPRVLVMMATYNGERYVAEQIDSILAQEGVDLTLVIRDDGSTDGTVAVCERYAREHANVDFAVNGRNKGCALNFMDMVYSADAGAYEYFAFSDQDDYWLPEKLAKAIEQLNTSPSAVPALYYSDVLNVDANLKNGHTEYKVFSEYSDSLKTLLLNNWASGCTMVWNRAMCEFLQSAPLTDFPRLHDVWLHLVALTCGEIHADLHHSYIKRRLTGMNLVGEQPSGKFTARRLWHCACRLVTSTPPHRSTRTAANLLKCYGSVMSDETRDTLQSFIAARSSIRARCRIVLDRDYRVPSRKESLFMRLRIIANRL